MTGRSASELGEGSLEMGFRGSDDMVRALQRDRRDGRRVRMGYFCTRSLQGHQRLDLCDSSPRPPPILYCQ